MMSCYKTGRLCLLSASRLTITYGHFCTSQHAEYQQLSTPTTQHIVQKAFAIIKQKVVCTYAGLTDFAAGPSSPQSQAAYPLQDPNLPGSSHTAESQSADINDAAQLHAPTGSLSEHQSAMDDSHSGTHCPATHAFYMAANSICSRHGTPPPPLIQVTKLQALAVTVSDGE